MKNLEQNQMTEKKEDFKKETQWKYPSQRNTANEQENAKQKIHEIIRENRAEKRKIFIMVIHSQIPWLHFTMIILQMILFLFLSLSFCLPHASAHPPLFRCVHTFSASRRVQVLYYCFDFRYNVSTARSPVHETIIPPKV